MTFESRDNRPNLPDPTRQPALPQRRTADAQRGLLARRMQSVRRWVLTASVAGTVAFSILAGIHTAASTSSKSSAASASTGTTTTATGIAQTVSATRRPSIFSSSTGSVAFGSGSTNGATSSATSLSPAPVRTSSS